MYILTHTHTYVYIGNLVSRVSQKCAQGGGTTSSRGAPVGNE